MDAVFRKWYPVGITSNGVTVGDTKNGVVFFWRTVGGGMVDGRAGYPTDKICYFDGMPHASPPELSVREFARLDWARGHQRHDKTNQEWAVIFRKFIVLSQFTTTGPLEDGKEGRNKMGNIIECLVGLAYAAVDGGRDLWRRNGSWIGIARCPGLDRQEVWRDLQLLWWVFAREFDVKSPKPATHLWPHDRTLTYDFNHPRNDLHAVYRAEAEPRRDDQMSVPKTEYGPEVPPTCHEYPSPSPLSRSHEALPRRGPGIPISAVGDAARWWTKAPPGTPPRVIGQTAAKSPPPQLNREAMQHQVNDSWQRLLAKAPPPVHATYQSPPPNSSSNVTAKRPPPSRPGTIAEESPPRTPPATLWSTKRLDCQRDRLADVMAHCSYCHTIAPPTCSTDVFRRRKCLFYLPCRIWRS